MNLTLQNAFELHQQCITYSTKTDFLGLFCQVKIFALCIVLLLVARGEHKVLIILKNNNISAHFFQQIRCLKIIQMSLIVNQESFMYQTSSFPIQILHLQTLPC